MDTAFRHLRSFSRNTRRHLTAVAMDVVNGVLPLDEVQGGSSDPFTHGPSASS
jgi:hypothetical protein